MALANYTDLQSAVADWASRSDLTARIPDFIALAEVKIFDRLRSKALEKALSVSYAISATSVALPADCISVISLRDVVSGRSGKVEAVSHDRLLELQISPEQADPFMTYVCVTGRELLFVSAAAQAGTITGRYVAREPTLASASTNWIMTNHPDIYLFATLAELYRFLRDPIVKEYEERFAEAVDLANMQNPYIGERRYVSPQMTIV